ncbi:MAG TPA: amphi-Trp domain-containing protein [Dehalococcoidia bacterium]|jgi:amphi-Trp domain-containing protein|nr:amphi-Trp domain-containing protein [Dehalococcoidia bacterium]
MSKKDGKAGKKRFRDEGADAGAAAHYLESIAQSLRNGRLDLSGEAGSVDSPVSGDVRWSLKAKQGKRKTSLRVELQWPAAQAVEPAQLHAVENAAEPPSPHYAPGELDNPAW